MKQWQVRKRQILKKYYYYPLNLRAAKSYASSTDYWVLGPGFGDSKPPQSKRDGWRRFGCVGKHVFQVGIGLIEEFFEIQIIHQHNAHHRRQA